jgi:hypothetical protein
VSSDTSFVSKQAKRVSALSETTPKQPKQTETNRNKPKNYFLIWLPHTLKNNRNRSSFGLFRFKPKKINCFEDTLIESFFWGFFRFVSKKFCLFCLFRYWSETPKQTGKKCSGFAKQTEKQPKQIELRFVSVRTEKNLIVLRTP